MVTTTVPHPEVVSRDEWLVARKELLAKEKELTRQRDALSAQRRRLPMVKIDKDYVFTGPDDLPRRLIDMFGGRRQLLVYHFMFDPGDPPPGQSDPFSEGCRACSFVVDQIGRLEHLHARDTSLVLVSRAPQAKIKPFQARMGWTIPWYSSFDSDFNYDFHVTIDEAVAPVEYNYLDKAALQREGQTYHMAGEQPGLSAFLRVKDDVFHTYSTYARGLEAMLLTFHVLDLTPYGRQEKWEDSPEGWPQSPTFPAWIKHHDKYDFAHGDARSCCHAT
jgi:predicted dithiol-disulfide oxidoreductase (DUF899 family)